MMYICAWQAPELAPERLISSRMTDASVSVSPPPPYASGMSAASQPASVSAATKASGYADALVHALPVVAAEPRAQLAHGDPILLMLGESRVDVGAAVHMPRNVSHGTMMARYTVMNTTPSTAPSTQKSRREMKPLP